MQTKKRISVLVLAVVLLGSTLVGCRAGSRKQGCPTFKFEPTEQQSNIF